MTDTPAASHITDHAYVAPGDPNRFLCAYPVPLPTPQKVAGRLVGKPDQEWVYSDSTPCNMAQAAHQHTNDPYICGRVLVGQGDDTSDPHCMRAPGHKGRCEP